MNIDGYDIERNTKKLLKEQPGSSLDIGSEDAVNPIC